MRYALLLILISTLCFASPVQATKFFEFTAEALNDGDNLPTGTGVQFYNSGTATTNKVVAGSCPDGSKFFRFTTVDGQDDAGFQIQDTTTFPVSVALGSTYYLAYYMRFTRIGGKNIWQVDRASADKGVELEGNGIRWTMSHGGAWGAMFGVLTTGQWSIWAGNPTPSAGGSGHLNDDSPSWEPAFESASSGLIPLNQGGYSNDNPLVMEYEKWYAVVMKVTVNSSAYSSGNTPDGTLDIWLNGTKYISYTGMWIASQASGNNIAEIHMGGTIDQDTYNAPAHYRDYDALLLTDSESDVANYLAYTGSGATPVPTVTGCTISGASMQ